MPCDQYELQVKNSVVAPGGDLLSPVAELEPSTSKVYALQHGQTKVVLDYKSILYSVHVFGPVLGVFLHFVKSLTFTCLICYLSTFFFYVKICIKPFKHCIFTFIFTVITV